MVMTTAPQRSSRPLAVITPATAPCSTIRSSTGSSMTSRPDCERSLLHMKAIELAVCLRARSLNSRTLRTVEHAELDASPIDHAPHQSIERIDLADEMPLAKTADRGVTGHLADGLELMRNERGTRTHAGGGRGCFATRVPTSHNNNVERSCAHA